MHRRSKLVVALVVACALALFASCGTATTTPGGASAEAGASIDLLVFGSPEEIKAYRSLIGSYEDHNPGSPVRLVEASDRADLLTRLGTGFSGGAPPDLFLISYRLFGQFASRGALEPLGPRLHSSKVLEESDFFPIALDAFRRDGELVCMPQNVSSLVVYYNKDLFAEAGVELPSEDWTWDEMVTKAKRLTKDTDGDGKTDQFGLGVEPSVVRVAPFVWSNGGELVDDPTRPTRFTLDAPPSSAALQDFTDLYFVDKVIPDETSFESEDNETRFTNGRAAMVMQSRRSTSLFRSINAFDWDVAALPLMKKPAGVLHSDAYCLAKSSRNHDAAWRFLEFALGPQGATIVARSGRTVPSLISIASSDAFLDPNAKPANSRVFLDTIPTIRALPAVSTWPEIEDAADVEIEVALWRTPMTGTQLGKRLDDTSRPLFERARR